MIKWTSKSAAFVLLMALASTAHAQSVNFCRPACVDRQQHHSRTDVHSERFQWRWTLRVALVFPGFESIPDLVSLIER